MPWKPAKGWMTPKTDTCVTCGKPVSWYWSAGYIVWDSRTQAFHRQHVECKLQEEQEAEARLEFPEQPPSGSEQAA